MSSRLVATSRLVAADQIYRPSESLTVYVVDVRFGWVICDVYDGTTRRERIRLTRATFQVLFSNYTYQGTSDEGSEADRPLRARAPGPSDFAALGSLSHPCFDPDRSRGADE